jgi:hypothetical protein
MNIAITDLNFAPVRSAADHRGRALLIIGALFLVASAAWLGGAWSRHAASERSLAALQTRVGDDAARAPRASIGPQEKAREQAMLRLAQRLQMPWSDLLGALEAAASPDVALLAVEPSALRQVAQLTAEARNPRAMFEYLEALQEDPRLSQVVLLSHQVQAQSPGAPLRFRLQVGWGAAP